MKKPAKKSDGEMSGVEFITEVKTLTHDEARHLATTLVCSIGEEAEELSHLMLLCYALVHSDGPEGLLIGVDETVTPSMVPAIIATRREVCDQLAQLRKKV